MLKKDKEHREIKVIGKVTTGVKELGATQFNKQKLTLYFKDEKTNSVQRSRIYWHF